MSAKPVWPQPRLRALQVEELYSHAAAAAAFSYFGALITLGVLIQVGDIARGTVWFVWATAVTFLRAICIIGYRRRAPDSDPDAWGKLAVAGNFLAGIQWGLLGTLLFPQTAGYLQVFTFMVIICFVAGSITGTHLSRFHFSLSRKPSEILRREELLARLPPPRFPEELPIAQHRDEIARLVAAHPVAIVCGETGSGKTTQIPKICLAMGRGAAGFIGCTQPRRIAARSLAHRLAVELPGTPRGFVGHKIRFQDAT